MAHGAGSFVTSGAAYDLFMGRYAVPLAALFCDFAGVRPGQVALDVGCGPGALTGELARRLGAASVFACDPSPPFAAECAARHPGVEVWPGRAEAIPFDDGQFDVAMAQLVLHFVADPVAAGSEFRRVTRAGATVAACVWDFADGMEMLRAFWDAALSEDPSAPDEARTLRFGRAGELREWLAGAGFTDIEDGTLEVSTTYAGFEELWSGFLEGVGPAGGYCVSLPEARQAVVRDLLHRRLGSPSGPFALSAVARVAKGRHP